MESNTGMIFVSRPTAINNILYTSLPLYAEKKDRE
jgi:hypothetical protein